MNRDALIAQLEQHINDAKPLLAIGADESLHLYVRQQAQRKASAHLDKAIAIAKQLQPLLPEPSLWMR